VRGVGAAEGVEWGGGDVGGVGWVKDGVGWIGKLTGCPTLQPWLFHCHGSRRCDACINGNGVRPSRANTGGQVLEQEQCYVVLHGLRVITRMHVHALHFNPVMGGL
jgi:hypothetical protein